MYVQGKASRPDIKAQEKIYFDKHKLRIKLFEIKEKKAPCLQQVQTIKTCHRGVWNSPLSITKDRELEYSES